MRSTHLANPVPAFDVHGKRIKPSAYKDQLQGSLPAIQFTLTRFSFDRTVATGGSGYDTFVADIEHIHILEPPATVRYPAASRGSPSKKLNRKFMEEDDIVGDISPKKQPRSGAD
ncbi:hypothetical protein B0H10DRAFT_2214936 [Mycena sp. CBHHK59/15]|nr:hypothetical protein B0H10DRAFT_2214936 [Mycena sp. CBHHK59/15]